MKKVLLLTLAFLLCAAVPAMASTYGPHGNYTDQTSSCSACHETHAAAGKNLFKFVSSNVTENCFYCHGAARTGSLYDAETGEVELTNLDGGVEATPANGGGFAGAITSAHNVEGINVAGAPALLNTAPGGGRSTYESSGAFTCASCHNPHGSGADRLLITSRDTLAPDNTNQPSDGDTLPDAITLSVGANTFDIYITNEINRDTSNNRFDLAVRDGNGNLVGEQVVYNRGGNEFCALCHYDYDTAKAGSPADPGDNLSGMYTARFRHKVGVNASTAPKYNSNHGLPLENVTVMTCLTCHKAHSTKASASKTYSSTSGGSNLLRYDERGVCIACHRWNDVNGSFVQR